MEIKIKLHDETCEPMRAGGGDWVDLAARKDVVLNQGEFAIIPLGVSIQLPDGYEALLLPRSSTFERYGIIQTNSIGVIDEAYCGDDDEWGMPVYATRDTFIPKGARICQFRIIEHQTEYTFSPEKTLGNNARGGFGSTGV